MVREWRRRRAVRRVRSGDGRALKRFRWWQLLVRDGRHHAQSKLPAAFPVQGDTVEVRMSAFGLKRCHYVIVEGTEHQLVPDPGSAEGCRAHPALSRAIGVLSAIVLVIAVALLFPQLVEQLTQPARGGLTRWTPAAHLGELSG